MDRRTLEGGEFDWFAVDRDGHIGHFSTAGYGPIPEAILRDFERVEGLTDRIVNLPVCGNAEGHLPGRIDDWLEMARRGLFSYDWKHWSGPYRRAATPSEPITEDRLPIELREVLVLVRFVETSFPGSYELRPERLCPCE